jgi:hypothetical protein
MRLTLINLLKVKFLYSMFYFNKYLINPFYSNISLHSSFMKIYFSLLDYFLNLKKLITK